MPLIAHGVGGRADLPIPLEAFIAGAGLVLVVSFVLLSVLWTEPRLQDGPRSRPIRSRWAPPLLVVVQVVGVLGLLLAIATGFGGSANASRNPTPVLVWVYFWLAIPFLGVFAGNLWTAANPWRSLANWLGLRGGRSSGIVTRWGVWPAVVALMAFTWLELVSGESGSPRTLAIAALIYSLWALGAAGVFGAEEGLQTADAFTSYNRYFSSIAPLGRAADGQLAWRGWLRALPVLPAWKGATVFIVAMIGTVSYDGLSATPFWRDLVGDLATSKRFGTLALVGSVAVIGGAFWLASWAAVRLARNTDLRPSVVAASFAHTLIPIAFAYAFAHYFTLVIFEGQLLISTLSDPFGQGWDLFGTAGRRVDFSLIGPTAVWYVQLAAILGGHVTGVILAHDRALALFPARTAVRSQYAMLGLMVLLTGLGLAILAAG